MRWSIHSYRNCQPGIPRNQTSLQESIFCCLQVWQFWEQLRRLAHSPLIVGMTIALLVSLEMCIVQIQSVWVNFACLNRLLNLWAEAIINAHITRLCARCTMFFLKIKQIPFSCRLIKGFTFLKGVQSQFNLLLEMSFVLAKLASTGEKCRLLGGYVKTLKPIHECGKRGAWLFVHELPFMLQEHVKTTQTDKTRFFSAKRRWLC